MQDPIGTTVTRLRAGLLVDGGTQGVAVRGGRRHEGNKTTTGDLPPLIIVRSNNRTRGRTVAARWRLTITSYETDPRLATLLDNRVSQILHLDKGTSFDGVFWSGEEVGGQAGEDPDTGWSNVTSVYIVHASTLSG